MYLMLLGSRLVEPQCANEARACFVIKSFNVDFIIVTCVYYVCIRVVVARVTTTTTRTSCARGRHNMPPPPASWPFDLESGVRFTCDVGYLCANFSLPRPLCCRLWPDVRDRQTSDTHHRLMPPRYGAGHNNEYKHWYRTV